MRRLEWGPGPTKRHRENYPSALSGPFGPKAWTKRIYLVSNRSSKRKAGEEDEKNTFVLAGSGGTGL